jgi:hypothetical protein
MRGDGRIFKPKGSTIWHTAVWIPYEHREWR